MLQGPLVSVILPAYNAKPFIGQAIQSVLAQTFDDFELIIVDDASNDNTAEIIHEFKDSRIKLITHEKNRGVCEARSTALGAARGKWIAPLDADDAWHRERLKILVKIAEQNPSSFVGSNLLLCFSGRNNELIPWKTFYEYWGLKRSGLYYPSPADVVKYGLTTLPLFPLEIVRKFNLRFQQEFRGHEWLVFMLNLFRFGLKYIIIKEPLYYYRLTSSSSSNSWQDMETQLAACSYLEQANWLDGETRRQVRKGARISKYRLLPAAFRERNWSKVFECALLYPLGIFYLLEQVPRRIWRQWEFLRLSQKIEIFKAKFPGGV